MIMPVLASDSATTITGTSSIKVSVGVHAGNLTSGNSTTSIDTSLSSLSRNPAINGHTVEAGTKSNDARDTKVFNTIYVAGATKAYDQVLVSVYSPGTGGTTGPGNDTVTVSVKNLTTGAKVKGGDGGTGGEVVADGTLVLNEASDGEADLFQGVLLRHGTRSAAQHHLLRRLGLRRTDHSCRVHTSGCDDRLGG